MKYLPLFLAVCALASTAYADQQISNDDVWTLVSAAFDARQPGSVTLPGFGIEEDRRDPQFPYFRYFEANWDNPIGSVVVGFVAIDLRTGDAWNPVLCDEEYRSTKLRKLQIRIRKGMGLSDRRYAYLRQTRRGPLCE